MVRRYLDKGLAWTVVILALSALAMHVVAALVHASPWDDGLMFVRYASHFSAGHGLSWNDVPTYGLTSQIMVLPVLFVSLFASNPAFIAVAASILCTIALLLAIPVLVRLAITSDDPRAIRVGIMVAMTGIAAGAVSFARVAASGMDTMLDAAYVAWLCIAWLYVMRRGSLGSMRVQIGLIVLCGLSYLVRPDLILFAIVIPFAAAFLTHTKQEQRHSRIILFFSLLAIAAAAGSLYVYYGTFVPLPFYAKAMGLYGPETEHIFRFVPMLQFVIFADAFKYIVGGAVAALCFVPLCGRKDAAVTVGATGASILAVFYYLFFVLHIMSYEGRFYFFAIPVLVILSGILIDYVFENIRREAKYIVAFERGIAALCLVLLFSPLLSGSEFAAYALTRKADVIATLEPSANVADALPDGAERTWPCLRELASVDPSATVATTEVGYPGALLYRGSVIDIAGLNEAAISLRHANPAEYVFQKKADLVYLPTRQYYSSLFNIFASSASFQEAYITYPQSMTGAMSDVAILKDGPFAGALQACIGKTKANNAPQGVSEGAPYLTLPYQLPN